MALTSGPNLGLLVNGDAGEAHYLELMRQFRGFDFLIQCRVINRTTATPPGSAIDGASYIVAASPTGAWVGHAGHLARYSTVLAAWEFFVPKSGWKAYDIGADENVEFDGTNWVVQVGGGGGAIASISSPSGRIAVTNGSGPNVTLDLADTGVTAGTYPNPTVTVDAKGRITGIVAGALLAASFINPGISVQELFSLPNTAMSGFVELNYV